MDYDCQTSACMERFMKVGSVKLLSLACMKYAYKLGDLCLYIYIHKVRILCMEYFVLCTLTQLDLK